MNQKNAAWATAEIVARISLDTTKPPVLAKLMSQTVSSTFCRLGGEPRCDGAAQTGPVRGEVEGEDEDGQGVEQYGERHSSAPTIPPAKSVA